MSGQVSVKSIPTNSRGAFEDGLSAAGVMISQPLTDGDDRPLLSRGPLRFGIEVYEGRPGETLVVVPYGPYTINPWHWPAGGRLFDDLMAILESLESSERMESNS